MATSTRTLSILGSLGISLLLIIGAYIISSPWFGVSTADAQDAQALLQTYAGKDTDSDGLFDWQEALYKTDPANAHSVDPTLTDLEAVEQGLVEPRFKSEEKDVPDEFYHITDKVADPNSLTDQFSKQFLEEYLSGRGGTPPTNAELQSFVKDAVEELNRRTAESPRYRLANLLTRSGTPEDIAEYIAEMDTAVTSNSPTYNEADALEHYADYVGYENKASLERVREVAGNYTATAEAIMKVRVPTPLHEEHLALANAYANFGGIVGDMGAMDTDPLLGLVGANRYIDAWQATVQSIVSMAQKVRTILN